jgi:hypothetical protein
LSDVRFICQPSARPCNRWKAENCPPEEAVRLIRDGDTIATGGFVGNGFAEEIAVALEALHLSTDVQHVPELGKPSNR